MNKPSEKSSEADMMWAAAYLVALHGVTSKGNIRPDQVNGYCANLANQAATDFVERTAKKPG